jgi:two-component system nitrogen regulation response regulator NtrX
MIMTPGDTIDVADLPESVRSESRAAVAVGVPDAAATRAPQPQPSVPAGEASGPASPGTLREFKEASERSFLVQKLRENAWNISRTAEVIGTPRSNLYKKLEFYKIAQETDG